MVLDSRASDFLDNVMALGDWSMQITICTLRLSDSETEKVAILAEPKHRTELKLQHQTGYQCTMYTVHLSGDEIQNRVKTTAAEGLSVYMQGVMTLEGCVTGLCNEDRVLI